MQAIDIFDSLGYFDSVPKDTKAVFKGKVLKVVSKDKNEDRTISETIAFFKESMNLNRLIIILIEFDNSLSLNFQTRTLSSRDETSNQICVGITH